MIDKIIDLIENDYTIHFTRSFRSYPDGYMRMRVQKSNRCLEALIDMHDSHVDKAIEHYLDQAKHEIEEYFKENKHE
jgi:hypothetical protein